MDEDAFKTFVNRVSMYRQFDEARQQDLEKICSEYQDLAMKVDTLTKDLDDEKRNRHHWRRRAEQAESSLNKYQYAVILVDGDGYIFNRDFYNAQDDSGGARAGNALFNDAQQFLKYNELDPNGELDITASVYCNQQVPAMALVNADILHHASQIQPFFWSFTSSRSFFQVIDCGPGKERADSKLRDVYRFHLNNAQCKYIFLACCHDSGYIAELDKYRQDPVASAKTILVRHGNTAPGYARSGLRFATFNSSFEMEPLQHIQRRPDPPTVTRTVQRTTSIEDTTSSNGADTSNEQSQVATWSTVTASAAPAPRTRPVTTPFTPSASTDTFEPTRTSRTATGDAKGGVPVNRLGQRIDKRLQQPPQSELDRFDDRIQFRKLCNTEHLTTAGCYAYHCKYDHDPIDDKMKHTLKYKARSIPCTAGSPCRKKDCFYGHQCPWGADRCTNNKCGFWRNGLHEITDLEIAKYVPAQE